MQFSFKRPTTSKSVSAFYRDKQKTSSVPKAIEPIYPSQLEDPNYQNQKWKKAAQKINKEMVLHRALHTNAQPFRLLSKIGGHVYSSQPKLVRVQTPPNKTRIRISSKEKKQLETSKQVFPARQAGEQTLRLLHTGIGESKLKRKRRGQNFKMGLEQQLKTANIFYESPVVKMGYNMQFQAYLRFEHIAQIRPDHGGSICRNSMIFFLKDAPFSPNIISEKNTQVPIALSLFPQFFDSKLSISNIKRQKYFQKMLDWMNSTYDPQRMAALPHFSDYPSYDHSKYYEIMESLMTSNQQNYKAEWAQNIVKKLRVKLSDRQLREALAEQWEFFNKANAMITLDYVLKDAQMARKLNVAPYMQTRVITARKILYHGGYCRTLYTSWSSYVDSSRKRLVGRLRNYTSITQSIFGWYCNFEDLQLYESDFSVLLQESLSVDLFYKIQQAKITFSTNVLQQIWFRGILCLYHYSKFLMKQEGQYEQLGNYRALLARYIREARSRSHQMKSGEEIQGFYLNFYENFLNSLRKQSRVGDLDELMEAPKGEQPQLSNIRVLLQIQFSKTVERSFFALRNQIVNYERPLLRLHLIIDRQSFKFLEQEQDIMNAFAQLIKKILGVKISGYALACKFQDNAQQDLVGKTANKGNFDHQLKQNGDVIRQYPEIYQTGERNSLEQDRDINIGYRTEFIFDEQVREILGCMKAYYKECFSVLGEYEMYLPFIKLTTAQMIFSEEEGPVEQSFLKNLRVISRYKESIRQLQKLVCINIFQVDCAGPIRALEQRVREIEYMMEQNYINIIHEKIEKVDSELNSLKTTAHNVGLSAIDIEETEEKLHAIKQSLKQLQGKMKKIAEMVLFCLDNRRKAETVVTCYCQLVGKKQDLHRDVQLLFTTLENKRPEVEAESQQQVENLLRSIDQCLQAASEAETACFEFVNLNEYITTLGNLLGSFSELNSDIQRHHQHCKMRSRQPVEQRISLFKRQHQRFELMVEYWRQFYAFESYFKEIAKVEARTIDFSEFSLQSSGSEEVMSRLQRTEQEWWTRDKVAWKPIVHRMHEYYSKKFKTDLEACLQLKPLLQMLTNRKVRERHWQLYGLEGYRNISFRELMRVDAAQQLGKLQKMDAEVNFQYEIFLAYQEIERKIKGHRLLIVDLNDSDVLDLPNLNRCVEFLRNVEIEIKELMERDVGDYYDGELRELLAVSQGTVGKLEEWRSVEECYIRFIRFHMINDDYEHSLFAGLIELHRKLIKSYDIDNSVAFISKNIVMDSYLSQISQELRELEGRVTRYLGGLRVDYPRLFLLNDEELFDFMSSEADLQKYLRKCFPQILNFGIREGSIERVGDRRELVFAQPFYIQEMVGRVNSWVSSLEDLIRCRLKEYFKTSQVISEGKSSLDLDLNFYDKYPPQLAILDEQITFTEQLAEAVATEALRPLLQQLESKIEYLVKQKRETFKLLLFMVFREQVNGLLRQEDLHSQSFQWLKYPRFYRKAQLDIRVAFIHQENLYGFNYLEKSEIIHTDSVFMGNCLVGPSGCGKTAFARYLAYLCGQELLIFDPRCISYSQESVGALLNFFRVSAFAGNWLLLQRVDLLGESQLRLIAECLTAVQESLRQQSNRLTLSGLATPLSKNCRILMSVHNLSGAELPGRLCSLIRPVWMATPNRRFLLELYLQSKRVNNIEVGKILKFCSWLEHHREISLEVLNWIRDQEDPEVFSSATFFQKACHYGIFQGEGQTLLETLRSQDAKMNDLSQRGKFISLHDQLLTNSRVVLFGEHSSGKTCQAITNLTEGRYLLINAHHYARNQELFSVVRAIRGLEGYSHVVFKHGLQFYPLMRDNLAHFRLLFVEDSLAQLQLGVVFDLRMINYAHLTENNLIEGGPVQLMAGKVLKGALGEWLKVLGKGTLFSKCLERAGEAGSERVSPHQLFVNFAKILKVMLTEQYEFNVAFLFSLIWAFSFTVEEKRLEEIVRGVFAGEQQAQKTKFQKISSSDSAAFNIKMRALEEGMRVLVRQTFANRLIALTELMPLKKGRFVSSMEIGGVLDCFQDVHLVDNQVVSMRGNFIANLSLLRRHIKSPVALEGKDWLTTILTASSPHPARSYNFSSRAPGEVFEQLFRGCKRSGSFYSFAGEVHVMVDDVHLANSSTLNSLTDLSEYGFALFLEQDAVRIFQTAKCQFTFAGKSSYPRFSKALRVVIEEGTVTTIFNEYVQCFCEKYLQVDRSIFSLLNLTGSLNRNYRDQQQRYFWYKNPLLLLQSAGTVTLTDFMVLYLDYLTEMLPMEKANLDAQRVQLELPLSLMGEQDSGVINTTRKFIKFCNETQLVEKLIADNEVLQEIQANQVQSIFFDKFIKNYFTKDILDYVVRVGKHIHTNHLILLADNYPHAEKILRYACKVSGRPLLSLRTKTSPPSKAVLAINLEHCKERELYQLESIVKLRSSNRFQGSDVRFVLTGSIQSSKVRVSFQKFPFLKSHFLSLVMRTRPQEIVESLKEIQEEGSSNLIEGSSHDYLQKLDEIATANQFSDELKQQFVRVLERYRKQQSLNLDFYRKISSEMMVNVDTVSRALDEIPLVLASLTERETQLISTRNGHSAASVELVQKLQRWEEKKTTFNDLFQYKHEREVDNLARLNQNSLPLFVKMDKIQRKMEGIESMEFTRLKNNLKNNENSVMVQPLHTLLAFLHEKGEAVPKDKLHQFVAVAFSTPASLANVLRTIRQRETYDKQSAEETSMNRPIATGLASNRLKMFLARVEEVAESGKKLEKVSPIYKPLSNWLAHFHAIAIHLRDFFDQQEEIDSHITSNLAKLNNKNGENADVNYQKLNLPVFITESQNRMQEISDTLAAFGQFGKSSEVEQRKLSRLKRFNNEREERLQRINRLLMESEYMKKVSAGVSLYFKNVDRLSFHRALVRIALNQCIPERMLDPELLFGVFTARADLFRFRQKLEAQSMGFEELEVVFNLLERREKLVRLVEDRDSLIKGKLLEAAEERGFAVQVFQHVSYPHILRFLQTKLTASSRLLVLHENIHYLQVSRSDNLPLFQEFVEESLALAQQRKAELIYVTNCLPEVSPQLHSQVDFGRVVVTRQRFMADLSDIFNVALQKELPIKMEQKKRRGDLETVIRERNSLAKEIMSSIESLSRMLQPNEDIFIQNSAEQIEGEQVFSQNLENQLSNLTGLQEQAQSLQRETTSYGYLPASVRDLIQEELRRYLSLYTLTDRTNTTTNNQFFPGREFYRQWIALLKDLREERITCFTRPEYRSLISEIVVKPEGEERPREDLKRSEEGEAVQGNQVNQAINPVFHRNNQEVFLALVQRLLRGTTWIQKSFLYHYALGAAVIQAFETYAHPECIPSVFETVVSSRQQINEECLRVLKTVEEHSFFRGYELRFDKLTVEFFQALTGNNSNISPGSQVAVITYYYLLSKLNLSDSKVEDFLLRFGDLAQGKRGGLAYRYQFIRSLRSLRQISEAVIRLTPPLSLSINLGEREKVVTIIEEEKYLLGDLVEVLKVRSLAKKRELESVLVDMRRRAELVQTLKQHYRASKQWLLLANFSVRHRAEVRQLLEELLSQLARLPPNPFFRIFIVLNREEQGPESLYYNKFEVSRVKGCHSLTDADYYLAVNTLVLQQLFEGGRTRELMEQLIVSTIHDQDDFIIAETRLQDLRAIFGKLVRRHQLLREEDLKLFYRNLVEEVGRLGYLKKEHNQANFHQYLAGYFSWVAVTPAIVRKLIEDERELTKMGLAQTQLLQNGRIEASVEQTLVIERINSAKIEEYFKNINSEFADTLRKEIVLNNQLEADQQFLKGIRNTKGISRDTLQQAQRVCEIKYGLITSESQNWVSWAAMRRLPLLRLLTNPKLRQICLSKKVDIQTPAEFWIFLTAFQQREIKEFTRQLTLDRAELESRYSNGIGLFGNFMNTRDYATRMRIVLVDEESYHELPISQEEITNVLTSSGRVEGRFILAIRKAGPQKITQLNTEHEEVEKIISKFSVVLQIGGELILEVAFK